MGRWSLVGGRWSLVGGRWSLVAGPWPRVASDESSRERRSSAVGGFLQLVSPLCPNAFPFSECRNFEASSMPLTGARLQSRSQSASARPREGRNKVGRSYSRRRSHQDQDGVGRPANVRTQSCLQVMFGRAGTVCGRYPGSEVSSDVSHDISNALRMLELDSSPAFMARLAECCWGGLRCMHHPVAHGIVCSPISGP